MKLKILIILAHLTLAINLHAQKDDGILLPEYKNLEQFNLKGNVKSIDYKSFKAEKFKYKDSLIKANIRYSFFHEKLQFDTLGRLVKEINPTTQTKTEYKYDLLDRLTEFTYQDKYSYKTNVTKLIEWIETDTLLQIKITPDTINGNVVKTVSLYHFDKRKNIVKRQTINNDKPSSIYEYTYDSLKRIIQSRWISSSLGTVNNQWIYTYNEKNEIVKWSKTDSHGVLNESHEFEYDEFGNKTKDTSSNGTIFSWEYVFDSHGNWTKRTRYKNGAEDLIVIREINYYIP